MAKMANTRRTGAKEAAQNREENKAPRPFKMQVIDELDGKPIIIRNYRVHCVDETVKLFDRQLNEHTLEKKAGELDFTRGPTVVDWYYDPESGECLGPVCLTHDQQYIQINPKWTVDLWSNGKKTGKARVSRTDYSAGKVEFGYGVVNSPNSLIPRFNVWKPVNEQAKIIDLWQREADAGAWIDGKSPSKEDVTRADQAYNERKAEKRNDKVVDATAKEEGPAGADEIRAMTGQNF